MKFNYQARTKEGEIRSGAIEASSREGALTLLQKYGLYITILEELKEEPIYAKRIKFFERVSAKELVLFSRQLSIMFASQIPLVESLRILASQTTKSDFREKILKISEAVEGGASFSQALSLYPKVFSSFYIAIVKSGEAAGKLSNSLDYLSNHLEREYRLTGKIRGAMTYPALILFLVLAVLTLMIFFVIPSLTEVLKETTQELPLITKIVIGLTEFLKKWALILFFGTIAFLFLLFRYYKTKEGKKFFDKFFLKIPIISPLLKMIFLSRFAENLSTLIAGGLPIAQAIEIAGNIIGNNVYREIIFQARDEVRRGEMISRVLSRFPKVFPPLFTQMTLVGERTGTLDKTMMNLVSFYQEEIDRKVEGLISILEPALIIFSGVIVGGLVASILMPLYSSLGGLE